MKDMMYFSGMVIGLVLLILLVIFFVMLGGWVIQVLFPHVPWYIARFIWVLLVLTFGVSPRFKK